MTVRAKLIKVVGIVQGVGFRPFIHRLAIRYGLSGYVKNTGGSCVEIWVEGEEDRVERFIEGIVKFKPPPAIIEELVAEDVTPRGYVEFKIMPSSAKVKGYSMIPPDIGICDDCLAEILNPRDRRFRYAFNSCAWCGPRFTYMYSAIYDRENTAMKDFPLCRKCLSEYRDVGNIRRYHVQGISCPECGPKVFLVDRKGEEVPTDDPIAEAAKLIDEGYIVAVKGLGGFHIAALASNDDVVLELRRRKRRPAKPFALMALNLSIASKLVELNDEDLMILSSPQKPILVLPRREGAPVSGYVAPGLRSLGVMLPYTGLHYLLLMSTRDRFLIMTSGNKSGKPINIDNRNALHDLRDIVDYFLLHNRIIVNRCDDSVIRRTYNTYTFLRRSRGYAPAWIKVPLKFNRCVVAFGADLSSAGAVAFEDKVILTQYIGDADDPDNREYLISALKFLLKAYDIRPEDTVVAADMHPRYYSTRLARKWAEEYSCRIVFVQHHHAHVASVMGENGIHEERIVGIAMDGTGYGLDRAIWGGEVILASYGEFKRLGHIKYYPLAGGDLTVRWPARMLACILYSFMDFQEVVEIFSKFKAISGLKHGFRELETIIRMVDNGMYVYASSTGRVLDALSALFGVCYERTYEGEPAIKLEEFSWQGRLVDSICFPLTSSFEINISKAFEYVIELAADAGFMDLAYSFQYMLGQAFAELALKHLSRAEISNTVFISGGAAVNSIIVKGIFDRLKEEDVQLKINRKTPCGDGGIALGQALIAGRVNSLISPCVE